VVLFSNLPACTVGLEACSGAHQLARELTALGHTVRIIAAKFVAPHRTSGKNDRNDARAIVDALLHPRTCQGQPKSPQLCKLNFPHPVQDSVVSSARTNPALSFSLSR
jgi:transposase